MKKIVFTIIIGIMILMNIDTVYADNATITFSTDKTYVGEEKNIEVMIDVESESVINGVTATIVYDSEMLEYISSSENVLPMQLLPFPCWA